MVQSQAAEMGGTPFPSDSLNSDEVESSLANHLEGVEFTSPEMPSRGGAESHHSEEGAGGARAEIGAVEARQGVPARGFAVISGVAKLQGAPEDGHGSTRVENVGVGFASLTTSSGIRQESER